MNPTVTVTEQGNRAERRRTRRNAQKDFKTLASQVLEFKDTDVITFGDLGRILPKALDAYLRAYHRQYHTPWYRKLAATVKSWFGR